MRPSFTTLVFLVMAASGIVFIEPAPMDFGIILALALGIIMRKIKSPKKPILVFAIIFIFVMANVISLFVANNFPVALRYFAITIYLLLSWFFYIGFVDKYKEKAVNVLFLGYTFAAVSSAILGLLAYFSIIPDNETLVKFGRMSGYFKDPNVFGPFMIPVALYALSKIEKGNSKLKWYAVFGLTSVAVLLSYSRAAWGSYTVALLIYFGIKFLRKPNFKMLIKAIFLVGIITSGLLYLVSIPQISASLEQRFAIHAYDTDRFAKQDQALNEILDYPFGIGPGQTELTLDYATHNGYLRIWLENGLLGFLSYILLIIYSLFLSIRKSISTGNNIYIIATASIVATLVNSFVIDIVHWRHFWFLLAIPWFPYYLEDKPVDSLVDSEKKHVMVGKRKRPKFRFK